MDEAINHLTIKYSACLLFFPVFSALVKAALINQFDFYFSGDVGGMFHSSSFRTVTTVRFSSASGHANNNKIVLNYLLSTIVIRII